MEEEEEEEEDPLRRLSRRLSTTKLDPVEMVDRASAKRAARTRPGKP